MMGIASIHPLSELRHFMKNRAGDDFMFQIMLITCD